MDKKRAAPRAPAKPAPMTLRLPTAELDARLRAMAEREHRSNHAQVLVYIEQGLARDEAQRDG